ncbi:hypothetical protein CELL_02916 [Cellulomonas sp. T2.31MG-18]|uniref:hypothetical protein n=1 Tax=Cellulomonas sp. T2.31MG-18 TaxID=3157619 RepID=UPI0035EC923D
MISVQIHVADLDERIATAMRLIDATHPDLGSGVSREARGLAVLLLFASYENLLTGLTRTLLEGAVRCGVSNRRLRPGFRMFAIDSAVQSLRNVSEKKVFVSALPDLIRAAGASDRPGSINTNGFPNDGSYFRRSQIVVWCRTFGVPNPEVSLSKIWPQIDSVVNDRNGIAHGRLTPEAVGRNYTELEIRSLISDWRDAWTGFLARVEGLAATRDFFRITR